MKLRIGIAIVSLLFVSGCAGGKWQAPSMQNLKDKLDFSEQRAKTNEFFKARFGESAGIDPRAREIEQRLGF